VSGRWLHHSDHGSPCASTVRSELGERFEGYGIAKEQLFDYLGVFHNRQRRHSTLGQISPAAFERHAAAREAA
jgi:putative transposase